MVQESSIMVVAVILVILVMLVFAAPLGNFVEHHPSIKILALSFLVMIGVMIGVLLMAEGTGQHFQRGYVYFAMAFNLGIELLNMRRYRVRQTELSEAASLMTRMSR
jgi:predicted tellurium resistance membrane protein TerC